MRKSMLFFVNPNAGHTEIRTQLMGVIEIFTQGGYDVTVHTTSRAREITELIGEEGGRYDMVCAAGGDGTFNEAVTGLMRLPSPPVLGYLPCGTVNDVGATLHLSKNPLEAAKTIVSGREIRIDLGQFNDRWFAYVAAFGAFTDVPYVTAQNDKRIWGRLAYLMRGVQAIGEIRPIHVRVTAGEEHVEDDVLFGLVSSTTSVGGFKAKANLDISLDDGLSEVVLVRKIRTISELNAAAAAFMRQDFSGTFFYAWHTGQISFEFDEDVPWTLDGEFGGAVRHAGIYNRRRALRVMAPDVALPAGASTLMREDSQS